MQIIKCCPNTNYYFYEAGAILKIKKTRHRAQICLDLSIFVKKKNFVTQSLSKSKILKKPIHDCRIYWWPDVEAGIWPHHQVLTQGRGQASTPHLQISTFKFNNLFSFLIIYFIRYYYSFRRCNNKTRSCFLFKSVYKDGFLYALVNLEICMNVLRQNKLTIQ